MPTDFWLSLVSAGCIALACAYLGSLMIARRMALVGDALGHVALPGMGLAMLMSLDVSIGAFVFLSLASIGVWWLNRRTDLPMEALVGIFFVASLSLGFLIVPDHALLESLIGDISQVSWLSTLITVSVSVIVVVLLRRIYRGMVLLNLSSDLARVEGLSVGLYNFCYLAMIAAIVSLGVRITGSLLVGALLIVPPAAARMLASSLRAYQGLCAIFGVTSAVAGVILARFGLETGPAIILCCTACFVLAVVVRRIKEACQN